MSTQMYTVVDIDPRLHLGGFAHTSLRTRPAAAGGEGTETRGSADRRLGALLHR